MSDEKSGGTLSRAELAALAAELRTQNKRVVFTNGVFDLLHVGHVRYLQAARDLGDALFVGINSDASVRQLNKGPERPLNTETDRAEIIAALSCVTASCVFTEDTPHELLSVVKPNFHVKGGDYASPDALPETPLVRQLGGEVVILPMTPARSTTRLVQKMSGGEGSESEQTP